MEVVGGGGSNNMPTNKLNVVASCFRNWMFCKLVFHCQFGRQFVTFCQPSNVMFY